MNSEQKITLPHIILASASPRRKDLLTQIGASLSVMPADVDESLTETDPEALVKALSYRKAHAVFSGITKEGKIKKGDVVLGADTVVALDDEILGKPKDEADAFRMIDAMQGGHHRVLTGVTLIADDGKTVTFAESTEVHLYPMSKAEIEGYVSSGEAFGKAGAYGIQGPFAAFVKKVNGSYTNVVGLPVGRVYQALKQLTH